MCGIFGVINKGKVNTADLVKATDIIKYRGPDDSGYLLWSEESQVSIFSGEDTSDESIAMHGLTRIDERNFRVGFGHRRLSILDLSPAGHQPMQYKNLSICYNGEIYNYIEIRQELRNLGRSFITQTDTEVILQAWDEWGVGCLSKFNGMFAFLILDTEKRLLYAIRDRFGVKPLYYSLQNGYVGFSSEVKQLRVLGEYQFFLNSQIAYDYLKYGFLDHEKDTFEKSISQLKPGQYLIYNLRDNNHTLNTWYELKPKIWKGGFEEAAFEYKKLLKDAVKLRLRSDVPVGSALSGGLDSSTIVCLMRELLNESNNHSKILETVTSCSTDQKYDETHFAELINTVTNSKSHKVYPSFERLKDDLDKLIWHMDYPFGSTSQFSQWCVFGGAAEAGLTVMIDGQGADEHLAGYGGNDLPLYNGLFAGGRWRQLMSETKSYKNRFGNYPIGFLLGAIQEPLPETFKELIPQKYRPSKDLHPNWLKNGHHKNYNLNITSLQQTLINQIQISPLPSLLRYEDRNSMAFSIESRTPFMDYRLIEFALGLPEEYIYKDGERKYILRKAFKNIVPEEILERRDKMGFVSAEERWMKEEGREWFLDKMKNLNTDELVFQEKSISLLKGVQNGDVEFSFDSWRIINFKYWLNQMK